MDEIVARFLCERGLTKIVAISGGASDVETTSDDLRVIVREALETLQKKPIAVMTNGTRFGVPLFTVEEGSRLGVPLIRVYPVRARERGHLIEMAEVFDLPVLPRVGASEWGDDAEVFVKLASGIIFIGGAFGTLIEIAHWAKIVEGRIRNKEPLIYAAPIKGVGGWSSHLAMHLVPHEHRLDAALPDTPLTSGRAAAEWLLARFGFSV